MDAELTRWLSEVIGPFAVLADLSRDPRQSRVWRVATGAETAVVKRHRAAGKFRREAAAWIDWPAECRARMPRLIAADASHRALVMSAWPGQIADPLPTDDRRAAALAEVAGAWLGALHRAPFADTDPLPLDAALPRRFAGWLARAERWLPSAERARLAERFGPGAAFAGCARRRCHRDFAPRNWLIAAGAPPEALGVIDFEHAGPDLPLLDLVRLYDGPFVGRPAVEAAFFVGYGAPLDAADRDRLARLMVLHGLGTLVWGHEHADARFIAHGRAILDRWAR